eukprot:scaffold207809_cov32-Tisochrysis_lutea.AAC.10
MPSTFPVDGRYVEGERPQSPECHASKATTRLKGVPLVHRLLVTCAESERLSHVRARWYGGGNRRH